MRIHALAALAATTSILAVFGQVPPAGAMTMKECSAKYQVAKKSDTLEGRSWVEFRKTECATSASAKGSKTESEATVALAPAASTSKAARKPAAKPADAAAPTTAARGVIFPAALAAAIAGETAGKQRMRTCLQVYHQNKEAGTLSGMRWIQKGGGYYSLCAAKLKAKKA